MTTVNRTGNHTRAKHHPRGQHQALRAGDEEVARLVGLTIAEFDADTTAPDPGAEQEQAR